MQCGAKIPQPRQSEYPTPGPDSIVVNAPGQHLARIWWHVKVKQDVDDFRLAAGERPSAVDQALIAGETCGVRLALPTSMLFAMTQGTCGGCIPRRYGSLIRKRGSSSARTGTGGLGFGCWAPQQLCPQLIDKFSTSPCRALFLSRCCRQPSPGASDFIHPQGRAPRLGSWQIRAGSSRSAPPRFGPSQSGCGLARQEGTRHYCPEAYQRPVAASGHLDARIRAAEGVATAHRSGDD
jgi:hypothetical protein